MNEPNPVDALTSMSEVLREDVTWCLEALARGDSQTLRRQLFRAVFAQIEATVYGYKQFALHGHSLDQVSFDRAEIALLQEEVYDLDDNGMARTRPANLPFASNFRFAMKSIAKTLGVQASLPFGDVGWRQLRESAKVRNRITHPKSAESLQISNEELITLQLAQAWFWKCRSAAIGWDSAPGPEATDRNGTS